MSAKASNGGKMTNVDSTIAYPIVKNIITVQIICICKYGVVLLSVECVNMMHVLVSVKIHKGLDVVSFPLVDMELKMSTYKTSDAYIDTFNISRHGFISDELREK